MSSLSIGRGWLVLAGVALLAALLLAPSSDSFARGPKANDPDIVVVNEFLPQTGEAYWWTYPNPRGEGGYGLKISGVHLPEGERRPETLTQDEFDILEARAKSWRSQMIGYRSAAGWATDVQFAHTDHFNFACDITNLSLYGDLGSDWEAVVRAYANRGERIWDDFEDVFGPTRHDEVAAPIIMFMHDKLNECRQTTMEILNYRREPVGPLRGWSKSSMYWERQSMPADTDIWESFTHFHAGTMIGQWHGQGRNQGSLPAWVDEGFAFYLTRIHRELDTHTTIMFAEQFLEQPQHIDGSTWKRHAERVAGNRNLAAIETLWNTALARLTQDDRILAWSMTAFLIETDKEAYLPQLMKWDKDGEKDGEVTREEFECDPNRFDSDIDGSLSESEQRAADDAWRNADINGDGVIDIESECIAVRYRQFIEALKDDQTDQQAMEQIYGWTLGDFYERWQAWLAGRQYRDPNAVDLDSPDTWREFKRAFERAMAVPDIVKRCRYIQKLARWPTEDALRFLYEIAESDNDIRIHEACRRVIAAWVERDVTDEIFNMAYQGKIDRKRAEDLPTRVSLFRGLGLEASRAPVNAAIARGCTHEEFAIRIAAIDVLAERGVGKEAHQQLDAVIGCLDDEVKAVRIAAVHALVKLANKDNELIILQALVDRLFEEKGTVKTDILEALRKISLEDWGSSYHRWARWLQLYRQARRNGEEEPQVDPGHEPGDNEDDGDSTGPRFDDPTYLEKPIYSKQIVFVIDRSYSMIDPVENKGAIETELDRRRRRRGAVTRGEHGEEEEEEDDPDGLDWDNINTKWDLARETLLKAVMNLPSDCMFTVVLYDHRIYVFSEVMVHATPDNKRALERWLTDQPDPLSSNVNRRWGLTNIYDALAQALEITTGERITRRGNGQQEGGPALTDGGEEDIELSERGAEAIFLLTDGQPTDGTYVNSDDILAHIRELNRTRKVKINTFGIGRDHARDLMQRIAEENHGEYTDLGFD